MRILVMGDIHGNLIALERVILLYRSRVDKIVCHGDVVNYGPWSNECVELLADIECICLKGNHENAYLLGYYPNDNQLVMDFFNTTIADFRHFDTIKKYGESVSFGAYDIIHTLNNQYYFPETDLTTLNLERNAVIGHSHHAFHRTLSSGLTLTNTGSIGQNRKILSVINFAIIDVAAEAVSIESIKYDPKPLLTEMKLRGYSEQCLKYYKNKME